MKLTQINVARLRIPGGKSEHIEFDEAMPGFGIRIRVGGKREHRTFIAQYKLGAKHRRITLGNVAKVPLERARKAAQQIFAKVHLGHDPAAEKFMARAAASETLDKLIADYIEAKRPELRPRSWAENRRYLQSHWKPLHRLTVSAVNRKLVAAQVNAITKASGPPAANRARATLSTLFRWAIGEGRAEENPVVGTNKVEENGARERSLKDAEVAAVWLGSPENDYGRIVRLILLTGCRRTELGDLRWSEIDREARTITLPRERTKNGQEHVVPLTDAALVILDAIPKRSGREFVFGNRQGGFSGWSRSKAALDTAVKLKEAWTLHDLRRTVRTGMGALGIAPHVAEAVLNHLAPRLIRTYDRNSYLKEKRDALERWSNHLAVAVAQASGANVTEMKTNRA
jgi:integrase